MDQKSRRFHWYIRRKEISTDACKCEAGTLDNAIDDTYVTESMDNSADVRFCGGIVSAKSLSNMMIIAVIQEISCGLIFATKDPNWFHDSQLVALSICRVVQFFPAFSALIGNYRNNSALIFPFILSQLLIGSYTDIQTYVLIVSDWGFALTTSPLLYLVLPLLLYAVLLALLVYIQYKAILFVNLKSLSMSRGPVDETLVESLM